MAAQENTLTQTSTVVLEEPLAEDHNQVEAKPEEKSKDAKSQEKDVYLSEKPSVEAREDFYENWSEKAEFLSHEEFLVQTNGVSQIAHFGGGIAIMPSSDQKGMFNSRILVDKDAFKDCPELIPSFVRHEVAELYIYAKRGFSLKPDGGLLVDAEKTVPMAHSWAIHEQWRYAFANNANNLSGLLQTYLEHVAQSIPNENDRESFLKPYEHGFIDIQAEFIKFPDRFVAEINKPKRHELSEPVKISLEEAKTYLVEGSALDPGGDKYLKFIKDQVVTNAPSSMFARWVGEVNNYALKLAVEGKDIPIAVGTFVAELTALEGTARVAEEEFQAKAYAEEMEKQKQAQIEAQGRWPVTAKEAKEKFRNECILPFTDKETGKLDFPKAYKAAEDWYHVRMLAVRKLGGMTGGFGANADEYQEFAGALEELTDLSRPLSLFYLYSLALNDMGVAIRSMGADFDMPLKQAGGVPAEAIPILFNHKNGSPGGVKAGENGEVAEMYRTIAGFHDYFANNFPENFESWKKALGWYKQGLGEIAMKGDKDIGDDEIDGEPPVIEKQKRTALQRFRFCLNQIARDSEHELYSKFPDSFVESCLAVDIYATTLEMLKPSKIQVGALEGELSINSFAYGLFRLLRGERERIAAGAFGEKSDLTGEGGEFEVFMGEYFRKYFDRALQYMVKGSLKDVRGRYKDGALILNKRFNESHIPSGLLYEVPLVELEYEEEPVLFFNKKDKIWETKVNKRTGKVIQAETGRLVCEKKNLKRKDGSDALDEFGKPILIDDETKPKTRSPQERRFNPETGLLERVWDDGGKINFDGRGVPMPLQEHEFVSSKDSSEVKFKFTNAAGKEILLSRREVTKNKDIWKIKKTVVSVGKKGEIIKPVMVPAKGWKYQEDQTKVRHELFAWSENVSELNEVSGFWAKFFTMAKHWDNLRAMFSSEKHGGYADQTMSTLIEFFKKVIPAEKIIPKTLRDEFICATAKPILVYRLDRRDWTPEIKAYGFDDPSDSDHYLSDRFLTFAQRDQLDLATLSTSEKDDHRGTIITELKLLLGYPCHVDPNGKAFRDLCRFIGLTQEEVMKDI